MALAWCLIYVAMILVFGYFLTAVILGKSRRSIVEVLGLSILLGAGGMGMTLLWISMLGIGPKRVTISLLGLFGIAGIVMLYLRGRLASPLLPTRDGSWVRTAITLAPVLGLVTANLLAMIPALGMPLFMWDSFVIWGLKAKVLHHSALTPRPDYFTDLRFSFSHLDYPLLLPTLTAGAYAMMKQVNDQLGKIVLPMLFAGQTLIAYVGARLWLKRFPALVVALLLIGAPFNVQFAGLGNADMALTTFRLASIVYLIRWLRPFDTLARYSGRGAGEGSVSPREIEPSPPPSPGLPGEGVRGTPDLVLCAFFTVFCAMTKSEGLPLAAINLLLVGAFAARARAWKQLAAFASVILIGIGIWLIWRAGLPHTDENYASRITLLNLRQGLNRIGLITEAMARCFADISAWGGIWLLLPLLAVAGFGAIRRSQAWTLWILLLSHAGLYALIYVVTPWDITELLPVTLERLTLHLLPAAMLLVAIHWADISAGSTNPV